MVDRKLVKGSMGCMRGRNKGKQEAWKKKSMVGRKHGRQEACKAGSMEAGSMVAMRHGR